MRATNGAPEQGPRDLRRSRLPPPHFLGATPTYGTSDLRHHQQRPQPGRDPLSPDAGRSLAGADRLHLPRRPPPHLRPVPGRLRHRRLLLPYIGTAVYAIVRPPEFLEDAHERELEIKAAELRVRQLKDQTCPNCEYPVEKNFLRCPNCQRRLKDPCPTCSKPVDPRWGLCPTVRYLRSQLRRQETAPPETRRRPRRERRQDGAGPSRRRRDPPGAMPRSERPETSAPAPQKGQPASAPKPSASSAKKEPARGASEEAPGQQPEQRSPSREPDPDPRQA